MFRFKYISNIKKDNIEYLKTLDYKEKHELANEIRTYLIEHISKHGGHLSSNLGIIEISIASLSVFQEENSIIYDVGHQTYAHKILTGRKELFNTMGKIGGLSSFPNPEESKYDTFESGHAGTSIAYMTGLLLGSQKKLLTIIGDASLQTAIALSSINYLGDKKDLGAIILINDNEMSISKTVGRLSDILKTSAKTYFETLGFNYIFIPNGHDIEELEKALIKAKNSKTNTIIHTKTIKGQGLKAAEEDTSGLYHRVRAFDINQKIILDNSNSYQTAIKNALLKLREEENFKVVTPAMSFGLNIDEFKTKYPNDFIDTGISEEQSILLSLGLIKNKHKTILLTYSTFIQRSYDYLINDIARNNIPFVIGLDRAGIIGEEGSTHQGIYDINMFLGMPNFYIFTPNKTSDIYYMFKKALSLNKPVVIRWPKKEEKKSIEYEFDMSWELENRDSNNYVISYGETYNLVKEIVYDNKLKINLINAKTINPLDNNILNLISKRDTKTIVIEEVIENNSLKSFIENNINIKLNHFAIKKDNIIKHGAREEIRKQIGFSYENILKILTEFIQN